MRDGGARRRRALAANHFRAPALGIVDDDRHVAAGAVQMRLDHLQRKRRGDAGVESVAAPLQYAHSDRGGDPVGGRDHPERAFDLGPGSEGIWINIAHGHPLWRAFTGGALDHSRDALPTGTACVFELPAL
jgi:hypothetical protein